MYNIPIYLGFKSLIQAAQMKRKYCYKKRQTWIAFFPQISPFSSAKIILSTHTKRCVEQDWTSEWKKLRTCFFHYCHLNVLQQQSYRQHMTLSRSFLQYSLVTTQCVFLYGIKQALATLHQTGTDFNTSLSSLYVRL